MSTTTVRLIDLVRSDQFEDMVEGGFIHNLIEIESPCCNGDACACGGLYTVTCIDNNCNCAGLEQWQIDLVLEGLLNERG